jgi:hypothetical protein
MSVDSCKLDLIISALAVWPVSFPSIGRSDSNVFHHVEYLGPI